jgi:SAM-dependent methyltransferase
MPWWRMALSRLLNAWFRRTLGLPIRDLSSSYRLYRRDLLEAMAPSMSTDAALQEILIKSFCEGYTIAEVPMHYIAKPGNTGRGVRRLARLGLDYVATFGTMWKLRNSIHSCDYDTRAFFSRIPLQRWWQRRRCSIVSEFVGDALRVLDAGCGSTQLLNLLPHVIGMDYSLRKVRFMRRPGRRLVNGSTLDLPFRNEAFDVVISSQVIEHLKPDARIFTELVRCLAPGGTLVLGTVDYGRWQWPLLERLYDLFKPTGYAQEHITHYTRRSLFDQLHALGLSVGACRYICGGEIIIKATKASLPPAAASTAHAVVGVVVGAVVA